MGTSDLGKGRPAVTTPYTGWGASLEDWWVAWTTFIFSEQAYEKIIPHPVKYQTGLNEMELEFSQPLQIFHLALFDGILMHMLNTVAPGWMETKRLLLTSDRVGLSIEILVDSYGSFDALLLQEVSRAAGSLIKERLPDFHVIGGGSGGNNNSLVLARKSYFTEVVDETATFAPKLPISCGDACVVLARSVNGEQVVLASYHSDCDGKMTLPFIDAFVQHTAGRMCLLGIDGNMTSDPEKGRLNSMSFRKAIVAHGLHSCLPEDVWTTYKARTFMQPQFQKAVLSTKLKDDADLGPKDHILATAPSYFVSVARDTTGTHQFIDAPLPTERFPSDHAIVAADVLLEPMPFLIEPIRNLSL